MIDWFARQPVILEAMIGILLFYTGWILFLGALRVGNLLLQASIEGGLKFVEIVSTLAAKGIRSFVGVFIGLAYVLIVTSWVPLGKAFDALRNWTWKKLDEAPKHEGRAPNIDDLVKEADPMVEARDILGLGLSFSRADFDAQYRKLMRSVHPDVSGSNWLATRVNGAKDTIMKQKGWKI